MRGMRKGIHGYLQVHALKFPHILDEPESSIFLYVTRENILLGTKALEAGMWEASIRYITTLWNATWKPSAEALLYPPTEFSGNKAPGKWSGPPLPSKDAFKGSSSTVQAVTCLPTSQPSEGKAILLSVSPLPSSESGTCTHCSLLSVYSEAAALLPYIFGEYF